MGDSRIGALLEAVEAMARRQYDCELKVSGDDEVGALAASLRRFRDRVRQELFVTRRLAELTERINAGLTLEQVLNHVYDAFSDLIPFARIGASLVEKSGSRVRAVWLRSNQQPVVLPVGYSASLRGSSLQNIIDSRQPRIINDLQEYLREHPESEGTQLIVAEGMRSSLTCPLVAEDRPVGFLFFSSTKPNAYNQNHVNLFKRIAGQVSLVVEKSLLFDQLLLTQRQLREANQQLARLASLDGLTGIPNRRGFDARLASEWRRAARSSFSLSLLMIDVDHFKAYNDRLGHQKGDEVLRQLARVLESSVKRAGDFVARYGGEEFAVLLPYTDDIVAGEIAESIRENVRALQIAHPASPVTEHVTASLGVASARVLPGMEAADLVAAADAALYRAKNGGRDRVASAGWLRKQSPTDAGG